MSGYEQNYPRYEKREFSIGSLGELESFTKWVLSFHDKGSFLYISGDLGVGKTTLAQFLCSELGIRERVTSPTFTILKSYWSGKKNCFINHFDFFRIASEDDVEAFCDIKNEGINIIEWPERAPLFSGGGSITRIKIFFCQNGRRIEVLRAL